MPKNSFIIIFISYKVKKRDRSGTLWTACGYSPMVFYFHFIVWGLVCCSKSIAPRELQSEML